MSLVSSLSSNVFLLYFIFSKTFFSALYILQWNIFKGNFPSNTFFSPNICKKQAYKANINKLEQTYNEQGFMPTIVCGTITFSSDTGTARMNLIRYILLIWQLCLSPYILLQLNPENVDTVVTLIGLNCPDQLHLELPFLPTAQGSI